MPLAAIIIGGLILVALHQATDLVDEAGETARNDLLPLAAVALAAYVVIADRRK